MNLEEAFKVPGYYLCKGLMRFYVRIAENEICHQINGKGEDDGILDREGWNTPPIDISIVPVTKQEIIDDFRKT